MAVRTIFALKWGFRVKHILLKLEHDYNAMSNRHFVTRGWKSDRRITATLLQTLSKYANRSLKLYRYEREREGGRKSKLIHEVMRCFCC